MDRGRDLPVAGTRLLSAFPVGEQLVVDHDQLPGLGQAEGALALQDRQTRDAMNLLREVAAKGRTLILSLHHLTDAERTKIRELLTAAREEAIDARDTDAKSTVFKKYKKQIQAYLNSNGRDWDKMYKDYVASAADPIHRIDLNLASVDAPAMSGTVTTKRTATNVPDRGA